MALGDPIRREFTEIKNRVSLASEELKEGARDFAPLFTGQLKDSIEALKPIVRRHLVIGILTAIARDKHGFDYAVTQEQDKHSHFLAEGSILNRGFMDAGKGDSLGERYWDGYSKHRNDHTAYATDFFNKGFAHKKVIIDEIMGVKAA